MKTLLISQNQIMELITTKEIVEICEKTFIGMGEETVINPTKVNLDLGESGQYPYYEGFMNAMPAYVGWTDTAGIKWAGGFFGKRKELGLPYITSLIMLIDPKVGNFIAVMDGAFITNKRTGAQTAVALKYIMDKKDITVGLYGTGMQGRTQIQAISELFNIKELKIYDVSKPAMDLYVEEMADTVSGDIIKCDDPKDVADADVLISVTQSQDKFIKKEWLKPGTVFFPMGSYQECEDEVLLSADKIVVDHVGQCLHRGALSELNEQGKITEDSLFATIGELASGKKSYTIKPDEFVVCIPIGTGAMDISVASIVYQKAKEHPENYTSFDFIEG